MQVIIANSTAADGSMKSIDRNFASVLPTRTAFLQKHEIDPADTALVQVTYGGDDFCRFRTLSDNDKGDGITRDATIEADALVVTNSDHALFLPLADCIGAVIHDPIKNILMVSHLGRHNLEQFAGTKCIQYLVDQHQVDPKDLTVWLSPAAGKENYPLYAFDNRSLHDVATEQLLAGGVLHDNITVSPIDSSVDQNYFSHSQFLKGNRETDGRFAVVAIMNEVIT
jgi:copper oxidase (laccase) domain-containing protein